MIALLTILAVLLALLIPQQENFEQDYEDWKQEHNELEAEDADFYYTREINRPI